MFSRAATMLTKTIRATIATLAGGAIRAAAGLVLLAAASLTTPAFAQVNSGGPATKPVTSAATAAALNDYRLDSGDQLRITVYNEPTLSGEFVLDGQGEISMPLIGEVSAKALTVRELQRLIEARFRDGFLRDPQVSAEIMNYRPYYILGEIQKPGEYPYISGLTVMNAIASAGDFTYRANKKRILIKSIDSSEEREVELTPTTVVKPGDTIRIRERFF
jgi:protein involved in polysaccharide export with SLBB domain